MSVKLLKLRGLLNFMGLGFRTLGPVLFCKVFGLPACVADRHACMLNEPLSNGCVADICGHRRRKVMQGLRA